MTRRVALTGIGLLAAVLLAALAGVFLGAGRFLEAPARSPVKASLLVSLGGDNGARADRVLALYRAEFAPRILLTGPEGATAKLRPVHQSWRAFYLISEGIPESALLYDRRSVNSWEEAVATLALMREAKLDSVLVVSDPPHMRRLDWVWRKAFERSGKTYTLVATEQSLWDAEHWWRTSPGAQAVFSEYIKLAYYLMQY